MVESTKQVWRPKKTTTPAEPLESLENVRTVTQVAVAKETVESGYIEEQKQVRKDASTKKTTGKKPKERKHQKK